MLSVVDLRPYCGRYAKSYTPYTATPAIAEMTINSIGDSFSFAKYLYPSIEAANIAVMMRPRVHRNCINRAKAVCQNHIDTGRRHDADHTRLQTAQNSLKLRHKKIYGILRRKIMGMISVFFTIDQFRIFHHLQVLRDRGFGDASFLESERTQCFLSNKA